SGSAQVTVTPAVHIYVGKTASDPTAPLGSAAHPHPRLTDGLARARLVRYGDPATGAPASDTFIILHVLPATYVGTTIPATAAATAALETWPALVNLPSIEVLGSTKLAYEDDTNPAAKHLPTGGYDPATETKLAMTGTEQINGASIMILHKTIGGQPIRDV